MATFQERFKGKTTIMSRNGLESVINSCQQPIQKIENQQRQQPSGQYQYQPQPQSQPYVQQKPHSNPQQQQQQYQPYQQAQLQQASPYLKYNPYQSDETYQYQSQNNYYQQQQQQQQPIIKTEQRSQSAKPDKQDEGRYKPYTLQEYEMMKKTANAKMGGLGPNLYGEDWQKEKEKQLKRSEFAEQVRQFNATNLTTSSKREQKPIESNTRQKALEFARNIPRPPQNKKTPIAAPTVMKADPFDNEIAKLEKEHLKYLNQLDKLK